MIALIGSHGVGKTTLLKELSLRTKDTAVKDGSSRMVRSFNDKIGKKLDPKEQQMLINMISDRNWNVDISTNLYTTRTPLDHYAYCRAFGWYDMAEERKKLFENSDYKKVKFLYIPIEFPLVKDGVRYEDADFQIRIDDILVDCINEYDLNPVVLTGSIEERVEKLLENIQHTD
tara:strand:- start:3623 stop:4144 length:522 start_codon:yes stop_codon:yes gene_type:complete